MNLKRVAPKMNEENPGPDKILKKDFLEEYKRDLDALWWQLVKLNSNIFVLEKISTFPFHLFQSGGSGEHFWVLIQDALAETSVMIIWRASVDNSRDCLTLQKLKNQIIKNIIDKNKRKQFQAELKKVGLKNKDSDYKNKVVTLRNNYFAHFSRSRNTKSTPNEIEKTAIFLSELKERRDELNSFFQLLCLGHQRALLPIEYAQNVAHAPDVDSRTDIEQILDNIARKSVLLNMPNDQREFWTMYRTNLSDHDLQVLNEYRTKFKLSPV